MSIMEGCWCFLKEEKKTYTARRPGWPSSMGDEARRLHRVEGLFAMPRWSMAQEAVSPFLTTVTRTDESVIRFNLGVMRILSLSITPNMTSHEEGETEFRDPDHNLEHQDPSAFNTRPYPDFLFYFIITTFQQLKLSKITKIGIL